MSRRTLLIVASLSLSLFAEPPDPGSEWPAKLDALRKKTSTAHSQLGSWCASKKLFEPAWRENRRAVALDASNAAAQKALGKKQVDGAWVPDEKAVAKTRNEGVPQTWQAAAEEYKGKRTALAAKSAKDYEALALWAAKNGMEAEARGVWREMVLWYDGSNVKARQALGDTLDGDAWVSKADAEARAAATKKIDAAESGSEVRDQSEAERSLGWKLTKRRSKHFFLEAQVTDAEMKRLVQIAETARSEILAILALKSEDFEFEIHQIVAPSWEEYLRYVDSMAGWTAEKKKECRSYGQIFVGSATWLTHGTSSTFSFIADSVIHNTAHLICRSSASRMTLPAWANEGLAWWLSDRLNKSAQTFCMLLGTGDSTRDLKNPLQWRAAMAEAIRDGQDPDLREVMTVGYNSLGGLKAVKCWSVIDWLLASKPAALAQAWSDMAGGVDFSKALFSRLEVKDFGEMEVLWELWVEERY